MKKLFSLMTLAVLSLLGSVAASAFTITFNLENAGSAYVTAEGNTYELQAGANELTFDFTYSYCDIEVKAAEGWKLQSVVSDNPSEYGDISIWAGVASQYFYLNESGRSYTITTTDLSSVRTASFTVDIDGNPETVQLLRDSAPVTLQAGTNIVKYDPATESEMIFSHTTYDPFYIITLNGEAVPTDQWSSFRYTVTVKEGDVVYIQPNYPDIEVPVTITCPIEDAITSVMIGSDTQDWKTGTHNIKAGANLYIYFNNYYKLNSVTCNGEALETNGAYITTKVGVEAMDFVIDAENYPQIPFTINIDDPARVGVWPGNNDYGTPFELVAGKNDLTISENSPSLYIRALSGNYIESITDAEGNEIPLYYDVLNPVTENMVINITSGELINDSQFALYTDCPASNYTRVKMPDGSIVGLNTESSYYAGNNYWVFPFCAAAKQEFTLTLDADPNYDSGKYLFFFEGDELKESGKTWMSGSVVRPADGTVYYGFAAPQAETPALKTVTFTADEAAAESVEVYKDIINEIADWQSGVQAFPGTLIAVKGGNDIKVEVDGAAVEATEDGLFKIIVSAVNDNNVVISQETTSITGIEAENAADTEVYNLQGIRVASSLENLPAGLYIRGGKKVIKK